MKKYRVTASEIVYYMKNVESENEEELRSLIQSGDVMFDNEDIVDGGDFELVDIEEIELSLTRDQIIRAMKEVADCHDCENGINWYAIDYALENQVEKEIK